jgi:hypothetical protein
MSFRDILLAFVSSVIGGLVVLLVEQLNARRKERRREEQLRRVKHQILNG